MRNWEANLYYHPEKNGFENVVTLEDPNACYDFQTVIVVRELKSGKLYAAQDAGCSCPTPFEDHIFPTDFAEIQSVGDFKLFLGESPIYTQRDIDAAVEAIEKAL
jgi:hypothetical protein